MKTLRRSLCAGLLLAAAVGAACAFSPSDSRSGTHAANAADCCSDVLTVRSDGTHGRLLLNNTRGWNIYDLSPQARRVSFTHQGFFTSDVRGRHVRRIRVSASSLGAASWSPDSRKLALELDSALWVVNANGGALHRVSDNATQPSWSPDSRWLVFVGRYSGSTGTGVITVADVMGTHLRELTPPSRVAFPVWSPRRGWVAYVGSLGERLGTIRVVPAAGGKPRVLARGLYPSWAPNGQKIAFVYAIRTGRISLRSINTNGTSLRRIDAGEEIADAAWSPDGRALAYVKRPSRLVPAKPRPMQVFVSTGRVTHSVTHEQNGQLHRVYWTRNSQQLFYFRVLP